MPNAVSTSVFTRHPRMSLMLVSASTVALFLLADFLCSTCHRSSADVQLYDRAYPVGHVHKPNLAGFYGTFAWDEYRCVFQFNNKGFRNAQPFDGQTTQGKQIVFAVGDSTTVALEVALEDSYPHVLNELLGDRYAVFNAGVRAYDTQQVILDYLTRLRPLKPAAVIYEICPNDLNNNVALDRHSPYVIYFGKGTLDSTLTMRYVSPSRAELSVIDWMRWRLKSNLNTTSFVCHTLLRSVWMPTPPKYYTPETMQRMETLLSGFDRMTRADGVKLFLTYAPGFVQARTGVTSSSEYRAYVAIRDFARVTLTNTVFIPSVDILREEYLKDPTKPAFTFKRNHHANAYGNRELARVIAPYVRATMAPSGSTNGAAAL